MLQDDFDPLLIQAFRDQPPDVSPIQALRNAIGFTLPAAASLGMRAGSGDRPGDSAAVDVTASMPNRLAATDELEAGGA